MLRFSSLLRPSINNSRAAILAVPRSLMSTEVKSESAEPSSGAASASAQPVENVEFPLPPYMKHRHERRPMPTSRGEAWGQILVSNKDLPVPTGQWTPQSRRVGALGKKLGMLQLWDAHGVQRAMTVIQLDECQVLDVNPAASSKGLLSVQLGCTNKKEKNVTKPLLGHFHKARVHPKQYVASLPATSNALLPVGWKIDARHFVAGQYLDITGITTGKGFAGVMKRHNFGGLRATHGVSVSHRSHGATGMRQDPGHVFKGKEMAGHMGVDRITQQNVRLFKVEPKRNLLFVIGQVPGHAGNYLSIRDAIKKPFDVKSPPPFPTFIPPANDKGDAVEMTAEQLGKDPFSAGRV